MKVKGRKAISVVMVFAIFASMFCMPFTSGDGKVYGAHWASGYLSKLAGKNVMRGDQYGNFNPDRNITRAEFAAMLNRAFGFQENKGKTFTDVMKDEWFADDISFASYQGYFQGSGDGLANPQGSLTREEAVTMICRALKIEPLPVDTLRFADSNSFATWSRGYINAASDKHMLSGYPDNTFRPANPITRGEVAKLISTVSGEIINQPTQASLGYVDGNVTLSKSGAGLRDTVIAGDLYITEGVLSGYVFLENVTVMGTVYISGAGESNSAQSSVVLTDCDINKIIIDLNHDKKVSVIAQGNSVIKSTMVKSNAYLEENNVKKSAFNDIKVNGPSGTKLDLSGDFTEVRIMAPGNIVNLNRGLIDTFISDEDGAGGKLFLEKGTELGELYIDSAIEVTGTGKINFVDISANGVKIAQMPDEIIIKPGYTATINGKDMNYIDAELENASPRITNGYPKAQEITATGAVGEIKGNKPGTIYWVVKETGVDTPKEEELREPKTKGDAIVQSGSMALDTKTLNDDTELSAKISGLKNGGEYDLYVMLVDSKNNASKVRSVDFETLDKVAPAFVNGYPKGEAVSTAIVTNADGTTSPAVHYLKFDVVPTKASDIYWIIMPEKSTAPTADRLFVGNGSAGELKHGILAADENKVSSFMIGEIASGKSLLAEDTPYDVYMGLKDKKGNLSAVNKTTIRTKDVTPPEFLTNYPILGTNSETMIEIRYKVNENATLYWALLPRGTSFPPGAPEDGTVTSSMGAIGSYWATDVAKLAVITGNSAKKSGNAKVTGTSENAPSSSEGQLSITGLETDTQYELYVLLADAAGNRNVVGRLDVSTRGKLPPTAKMMFDESTTAQGGDPPVGSVIKIAINKPVTVGDPPVDLLKIEKSKLGDYIKLYSLDQNDNRKEEPINFANVTIDEKLGYPVISFPTTGVTNMSPDAAVQMESSGKYYFELNSFKDMQNPPLKMETNTPSATTRLQTFQMKAPFVSLKNVTTNVRVYDMLFDVEPQTTNVSETLKYENVFETSRKITFDLYEIDDLSASDPTTDAAIASLLQAGQIMETGKYYPMQTFIQQVSNPQMPRFRDLTTKRYGIVITAIEGDIERPRWSGNVTLTVRGVSGDNNAMDALSGQSTQTFTSFMASSDSAGISIVSDPVKFDMIRYFQDTTPPIFVIPTVFVESDTTVRMDVMLDKAATVYWLAAPDGSVDPDKVTTDDLLSGKYRSEMYKTGSFNVPNGNAVIPSYIPNPPDSLTPQTNYNIFYFARANASSLITHSAVTTLHIGLPGITADKDGQGEKSAYVRINVTNRAAQVYWVVYPRGTFPTSTPTAGQVSGQEQAPGGMTVIDSGSLRVEAGASPQITCKNLEIGLYYDVFLVAKNPIVQNPTASDWTTVIKVADITPKDTVAPKINSARTTITDFDDTLKIPKFDGTLTVEFSKPLYYVKNTYGEYDPLDEATFKSKLSTPAAARFVNISASKQVDTDPGISQFKIDFTGAVNNDTFSFTAQLGDGANMSGFLSFVFVRNVAEPDKSYWDVKFVSKLGG